jgi:hypothetical protein
MFWNPLSVNVFRTMSSERQETREVQEEIRPEAQYPYSAVIYRGPLLLSSCARGQRQSVSYRPENENSIVIFYSKMRQFGAP